MSKRSRKAAKAVSSNKEPHKPSDRSDNHVCFKGSRSDYEKLNDDEVSKIDDEFFVNPSGTILYRACAGNEVISQVLYGSKSHGEVAAREFPTAIVCGIDHIVAFCKENRVSAPGPTRDKRNEQEAKKKLAAKKALIRTGRFEDGPRQSSAEGGQSTMPKSTNGNTIGGEWSNLFIENAKLAKDGKALTDSQLRAAMYEAFPDKEHGITTIERVSMQRSCYNNGTAQFKKFGASGTKNRPASHRYDDGSTPVAGRGRGKKTDVVTKKAAKKTEKKNSKKSAKISSKKSSKKSGNKKSKK